MTVSFAAVATLGLVLCGSPVRAAVLLTEEAALERAFPGLKPQRRVLYLTPAEVRSIEKEARSRMPSAIVTVFEARDGAALDGWAVLDTHIVRTLPETILTVIEPNGELKAAMVLHFGEPPDYLPRPRWLETLRGKQLSDELWPGRGVRRVTGASLTVHVLTSAVRRALAIERLILRPRS